VPRHSLSGPVGPSIDLVIVLKRLTI
jgi:hypothetical protein